MKKHTVLITGAAGYIGAMLATRFARRPDVGRIIGIDKEPMPENFKDFPKLTYFQINTADNWEEKIRAYHPTIVVREEAGRALHVVRLARIVGRARAERAADGTYLMVDEPARAKNLTGLVETRTLRVAPDGHSDANEVSFL